MVAAFRGWLLLWLDMFLLLLGLCGLWLESEKSHKEKQIKTEGEEVAGLEEQASSALFFHMEKREG